MKKINIVIVIIITSVLYSCGNENKKQELEVVTVEHTTPTEEVEVKGDKHTSAEATVTFKDEKIGDVYNKYIALKTALVNTNADKSSEAATNLMTTFANVGVEDNVLVTTQSIVDFNDIETHRKAFSEITKIVEKMIDGQVTSGTIYKQYCPMAFDFKGDFWLSNSSKIYNPYFGDKMLHCGKIDSKIE